MTYPSSKSPSHLLKTNLILACFPNALRYFMSYIYYTVTGFFESTTKRIKFDQYIAEILCLNIYYFRVDPDIAPFFSNSASTPGVSIRETKPFRIGNDFLSLVVPRWESTIAIFSPIRLLNKLLLPQFGRPTRETRYLLYPSAPLFHGFGCCEI